ncbi:uncharacterized protein LOC129872917 [Solanum dulcamara]|uniref:uncharacterized protein LOC129872917 n=1 Tax=Solanum dulcamara TaxID=45834 RepID=UPI0024857A9B|nr:uncharacterized protein LOC129872917 [Solanum dulcamara]
MSRAGVVNFKGSWDDYPSLIEFPTIIATTPVPPMKGVIRFDKKGKPIPRYIGLYQTVQKQERKRERKRQPRLEKFKARADSRAQFTALSTQSLTRRTGHGAAFHAHRHRYRFLESVSSDRRGPIVSEPISVYLVFHVSLLRIFIGDPSPIVPLVNVEVNESLSYEEVPVEILDQKVRKLRNKEVASINVLWRNQEFEGVTWEAEANIISQYPHLFPSLPSWVFACRCIKAYKASAEMVIKPVYCGRDILVDGTYKAVEAASDSSMGGVSRFRAAAELVCIVG